jgi:hypothetical protein
LEFSWRELFEFVFGLGSMAFEFLVFQVVPDLLVRIPVWGVLGKMKHV